MFFFVFGVGPIYAFAKGDANAGQARGHQDRAAAALRWQRAAVYLSQGRAVSTAWHVVLQAAAAGGGHSFFAEDVLEALKTASAEYMERLASLFEEKKALAEELFETHGVLLSEW